MKIVKEKVPDVREYLKQMHVRQDRILDEIAYGTQSKSNPALTVIDQDKNKMNAIDELTSEDEMSNSQEYNGAQHRLRLEIQNHAQNDFISPK